MPAMDSREAFDFGADNFDLILSVIGIKCETLGLHSKIGTPKLVKGRESVAKPKML